MNCKLKILVIVLAFLLTSCGQKQNSKSVSPEVTTDTIEQVNVGTTENKQIRFYDPINEYIEMTARDTAALDLANRVSACTRLLTFPWLTTFGHGPKQPTL